MRKILIAAAALAVLQQSAIAAVSAAEAEKLKTVLTPLGAEKAGNADGTIPAWTGGYTGTPPAGRKPGELGVDPFPNEKPTLKITGADLGKYSGKLSETVKYLLKTYPDFYINVYPTHRTAVAPQWVYDNTYRNATTAKLSNGNNTVTGAYGGTPFPIPTSGGEVLWNHFLAWKGAAAETQYETYLVSSDGRRSLASQIDILEQYPYYEKDGRDSFNGYWWLHRARTTAPSRSNGEDLMGKFPMDYQVKAPESWQYLPGQRRVRKLPNVSYDTPNFYISGTANFDEAFGFFGLPDEYDFKIIGKQEMYIPYNTNKVNGMDADKVIGPAFLKPEELRWELHRVWVVEGTLAAGKRNVIPKRRMYMDEDTWNIVASDHWDAQGKLYRGMLGCAMIAYDTPAVIPLPFLSFDFQTRAYGVNGLIKTYAPVAPKPATWFNPDRMVQDALR